MQACGAPVSQVLGGGPLVCVQGLPLAGVAPGAGVNVARAKPGLPTAAGMTAFGSPFEPRLLKPAV